MSEPQWISLARFGQHDWLGRRSTSDRPDEQGALDRSEHFLQRWGPAPPRHPQPGRGHQRRQGAGTPREPGHPVGDRHIRRWSPGPYCCSYRAWKSLIPSTVPVVVPVAMKEVETGARIAGCRIDPDGDPHRVLHERVGVEDEVGAQWRCRPSPSTCMPRAAVEKACPSRRSTVPGTSTPGRGPAMPSWPTGRRGRHRRSASSSTVHAELELLHDAGDDPEGEVQHERRPEECCRSQDGPDQVVSTGFRRVVPEVRRLTRSLITGRGILRSRMNETRRINGARAGDGRFPCGPSDRPDRNVPRRRRGQPRSTRAHRSRGSRSVGSSTPSALRPR